MLVIRLLWKLRALANAIVFAAWFIFAVPVASQTPVDIATPPLPAYPDEASLYLTRVAKNAASGDQHPEASQAIALPLAPQSAPPSDNIKSNPTVERDARRLAPVKSHDFQNGRGRSSEKGRALPSFGLPVDSMYTMGTGLAIVTGLFLLVAWTWRRGAKKANHSLPEGVVAILGRVPLASRQVAELVRVGNKLVLLSVTPHGVEPLTEITDPLEIDRLVGLCREHDPKSSTADFDDVFRQFADEPAPDGFLGEETMRIDARSAAAQAYSPFRGGAIVALIAALVIATPAVAQTNPVASLFPSGLGGPQEWTSPEGLSSALQVMLLLTVISLAPAILLMTTSFVRIVVVLGLLRQALGTQQLPPSQVVTSIALFMTVLLMAPTWQQTYEQGIEPYTNSEISLEEAFTRGVNPIRRFMAHQIEQAQNDDDVYLFMRYLQSEKTPVADETNYVYYDPKEDETIVPLTALLPAYMLSELKIAFLIGFQIYLPFVVLDIVVASVTISMGMLMLPPVLISLPFKLLLFVLVDGWHLVVEMLLESFHLMV